MTRDEKLHEWLRAGVEAGFITEPFCWTHDGPPPLDEEEFGEGGEDWCVPGVRLLHEDQAPPGVVDTR